MCDISWLAGFYEGEGSISASLLDGMRYIRLTLTQKGEDREILLRAKKILSENGVTEERITLSTLKAPKHLHMWQLRINVFEDVEKACLLIVDQLGTRRREQIREAFLIYCEDYVPKGGPKSHNYKQRWSNLCDI